MEKTIGTYADILQANGLVESYIPVGDDNSLVRGITYDSREVKDGFVFVCKGAGFKKDFLLQAISAGCICYVSEKDYNVEGVSRIIVSDVREAMPHIAKAFYEIPEDFKVIGVTGTKGKTTTAYYIKSIFDEAMRMSGRPEIGLISSIDTYDGQKLSQAQNTTPESFELYRYFKNASDCGIGYLVMEVSSQALKYKRTEGICFDTAIFLNISEDHISPVEHQDFDDYFNSKLKIFAQCKTAIVCTEAEKFDKINEAARKADAALTFGMEEGADIRGFELHQKENGSDFKIKHKGKEYDFFLDMCGSFNVENALGAIAVAVNYGLPYEAAHRALSTVKVPGRMEEYVSRDNKIRVIVDYAHNKVSFQNIFRMAKSKYKGRKIVSLFGSTGGKGLNRRRDVGTVAGLNSDMIYLTAQDPGSERVGEICAHIGSYVEKTGCKYEIVEDRKEAIFKAVLGCTEPTVVLLLGKGSEKTMKTKYGRNEYESDVVIAKKALEQYDSGL